MQEEITSEGIMISEEAFRGKSLVPHIFTQYTPEMLLSHHFDESCFAGATKILMPPELFFFDHMRNLPLLIGGFFRKGYHTTFEEA